MHDWLLRERETLSRSSEVLKPMNYMLRRWADFARFLDDGRICLSNNAAERALRGIALGRRNWTFAGSMRGADRAAIMLTMITTCRLNDVDPEAWLADVPSAFSVGASSGSPCSIASPQTRHRSSH
ncbi:Transposase IS66 family protein [Bradyrhizobium sp. Rc2d]|nr:Transposase IS66 family protein [Bradyrhizobium sp. Rc2d]